MLNKIILFFLITMTCLFMDLAVSYSQIIVPNQRNPQLNFQLNPQNNIQINPNFTATLHPKYNSSLNPTFTPSIHPEMNSAINPMINPDLNPDLNASYNPDYNSAMSPYTMGSNRLFLFSVKAELVGMFVISSDKKFMYRFDSDFNKVSYWVTNQKGGYNEFDSSGTYTGSFMVSDGMGGWNVFDKELNWINFVR